MRSYVIIPARLKSSRFPRKPLQSAYGKSLLQMTYERASLVPGIDGVIVATPDQEIMDEVDRWKGTAYWTGESCPTGTHRAAEAVKQLDGQVKIVNWQVDEPEIDPSSVKRMLDALSDTVIMTMTADLPSGLFEDPNQTKAIVSNGRCLWFSRAHMNGSQAHVGVYAYHKSLLLQLGNLKPTRYSLAENLEQLAWLENGYVVNTIHLDELPVSVNCMADWLRLVSRSEPLFTSSPTAGPNS